MARPKKTEKRPLLPKLPKPPRRRRSLVTRPPVSDIEALLRDAKREARTGYTMVEVRHPVSGIVIANVWPEGRIDATIAGSRFVGIVPSARTEPTADV